MATKNNYSKSIKFIDGLMDNTGEHKFPLVDARDIYVDDTHRLSNETPGSPGALEMIEADLATTYDASVSYIVGDYCLYDHQLYRCTTAGANHTPAASSSYWTATNVMAEAGSGVGNSIAEAFATNKTYAVGDYVVYQRKLYRCTSAVETAGNWTGTTNWIEAILANDVADLKSAIEKYNSFNLIEEYGDHKTTSNNGTQIAWESNDTCKITTLSAATGYPRFILMAGSEYTQYFEAGEKYKILYNTTDPDIWLEIIPYINGTAGSTVRFYSDGEYVVPQNLTNINIRIWCNNNSKTYNATVKIGVLNAKSNKELQNMTNELYDYSVIDNMVLYNSYDIFAKYGNHDVTSNNGTAITWTDKNNCTIITPSATTGYPRFTVIDFPMTGKMIAGKSYKFIFESSDSDIKFEIYTKTSGTLTLLESISATKVVTIPTTADYIFCRIWCNSNSKTYNATVKFALLSALSNWDLQEAIKNVQPVEFVNKYTFNNYENSYQLTATPEITADTNNYLQAHSGDMTAEIQAMLTANGVCHLGPGGFTITGITLAWGQMLIGSGKNTTIYFDDSVSDGYAIKMESQSCVKDLCIRGQANSVITSATVGTRHGILIQGNATQGGSSAAQPQRMTIDNVYISRLNGGAITLHDTGMSKWCMALISNVHIYNCDAGINVDYYSEFNQFTNICANGCYYGCVNNGGNNMFVNCDFSGNKIGILMDNASGQSPNNTHGSAIGCIFNHEDENAGIGIKIVNCHSGFMFTGCQIFYSQIYLENSDGIVIADTNFGKSNCKVTIIYDSSTVSRMIDDPTQPMPPGTIVFSNCLVEGGNTSGQNQISITGNNNVHFVNCYNKFTGSAWGQS